MLTTVDLKKIIGSNDSRIAEFARSSKWLQ